MDLELAGRHALVTGASKGIGLAVAQVLAAEGCAVTLVSRDAAALERAAAAMRQAGAAEVTVLAADLSRSEDQGRVAAAVAPTDILVNNAGAIPPGDILAVDEARWREAWDLKVFGYINLTRLLWERLCERRGVVVNVIGAAGEHFPPGYVAGAAGNAALMALTRSLGRAAAPRGLRVVGINPGPVATDRSEMLLRARARAEFGDEARWQDHLARMAYGRQATPREIADAVAFLASPRSAYTNGTILTIDGGAA